MRAMVLAVIAAALVPLPARAVGLEKQVASRWLGAWVVTEVEARSDCLGSYTNNRINGRLVKSSGGFAFAPGELVRVDSVDVKRSRVDLHLTLVEPVLSAYADGPFTLYRDATCRVEYQVEMASEEAKRRDLDRIDRTLLRLLERYDDEEGARASARWNRRVRDPYPDDYDLTLARHAAWKAETTNQAIQAKLDQAVERTSRLRERIEDDPAYLAGFASGVQEARRTDLGTCSALLAVDLAYAPRRLSPGEARTPAEAAGARGAADGRLLVHGLELIRRLPECFVPVPEVPEAAVAASR